MKFVLAIFILLFGTGCHFKESFQPSEAAYYYYQKPSATKLDVEKAMLECGIEPIQGYSADTGKYDVNTALLASACMERLGFRDIEGWSFERLCNREHNAKYPACQPGAVIPKPSVERRLNSKYCQHARSLIDPVEYQRCLKEDAANSLDSTTAEDCVYWNKELRAECRP